MLGDLAATDAGHIDARACISDIRLDTPKGEWQGDQGQEYLDHSLVVANVIEHADLPGTDDDESEMEKPCADNSGARR